MDVLSIRQSSKTYKEFPMHQHGYWEILLHAYGDADFKTEDFSVSLSSGDICIIPPGISHSKISNDGFSDISILIKDMRPIGEPAVKILHDDADGTIQSLLEAGCDIYNSYMSTNDKRIRATLNSLGDTIYHLLAYFYVSGRQKDLRVENFIEHMENHISDIHFDLALEIEKTGYSKGYFRQMFKAATGTTPVSYLHQLRIHLACEKFHRYGESRSIKSIAFDCGFPDPYYFSRIFKNTTGMSPKTYIRQIGTFEEPNVELLKNEKNSLLTQQQGSNL